MVKKALAIAAERLMGFEKPTSSVSGPFRRHLVIIRLSDGDWVLQVNKAAHAARHQYKKEAKTLLQKFFAPAETVHCAARKADEIFFEALNFRRSSDMEVKPHFERTNTAGELIEWHPVVVHLAYAFDQSIFDEPRRDGKLEDMLLQPLDEHKFAAKLRKLVPAT